MLAVGDFVQDIEYDLCRQIILQWSQDFGIQLPGLIMKMDTALLWGRRNYVSAWRALHVLDVFL
jgi:hypothetical protein